MVHYRWHPLHGRRVRLEYSERRADGEVVHVEAAPGVITVVPAWMLEPAACMGMEIGHRAHKKALLRCLVEKVVLHRTARERIDVRIVWRGGEVSEEHVEPRVHALHAFSHGAELQARILALARQGLTDAEAAEVLTGEGYRSPRGERVLARTVQVLRPRHRVLRGACRTHPRHIPGWLTMAELARRLQVSRYWIERRLRDGTIGITRDAEAKRYLFPDTEATIAALQKLKSGKAGHLNLALNTNG